jgi:hypothetical protein
MRSLLFAVATAVVGAAVASLIFTFATSLPSPWQWIIVAATGLVGFIVSWLLTRRDTEDNDGGTTIGKGIRSGNDVEIEDISVYGTAAGDVNIGMDIKSKGSTRLHRIRLREGSPGKQ